MKKKSYGFTIIELLGAIIIISVALLSILSLLRISTSYTNKSRQETIAINLAREGIEGMYNRRNTNWLRQSGEKDKNRLNIDNATGDNAMRFNKGLYKLNYLTTDYGKVIIFHRIGDDIDDTFLGNTDLLLSSTDFIGGTSPDGAGKFYRAIVGLGLYQKDTNVIGGNPTGKCVNGTDGMRYEGIDMKGEFFLGECSDSHPKEYRFCSRVEYEGSLKGKVELCGSITNYQE